VAVILQDLVTVRRIDLQSAKQSDLHPHVVAPLSALQFSPDGEMLVLGEGDQLLSRWNVATLRRTSPSVAHEVAIYWRFQPSGLSVGPDAETAILCDGFQSSRVDFTTGKESKFDSGSNEISFAAINGDGRSILLAKRRGMLLYDLAADQWTKLKLDIDNSQCLAASPDLKHVLAVNNGSEVRSSIRILRIGSDDVQTTILRQGWGQAAAFSRNGTRVAAGIGSDIDVWDTATDRLVASLSLKPRHRLPWTLPLAAFVVWSLIVYWLRRREHNSIAQSTQPVP
jgi:WD40 repeat protein